MRLPVLKTIKGGQAESELLDVVRSIVTLSLVLRAEDLIELASEIRQVIRAKQSIMFKRVCSIPAQAGAERRSAVRRLDING